MIASFVTAKNHCLCCLMASAGKGQIVLIILLPWQFIATSSSTAGLRDSCSSINTAKEQAGCSSSNLCGSLRHPFSQIQAHLHQIVYGRLGSYLIDFGLSRIASTAFNIHPALVSRSLGLSPSAFLTISFSLSFMTYLSSRGLMMT